ncbi:Cache sensor-containing MCP-domain signal transduction protein [Arcobacter venerupis]|uniref:Cache sensor-containing MCP-domain signal transduction protein n=1 Tax=Arcobacter venerupis TaxID=1054033 RepID=A0AAE7BAA8_9BACT|nr:methyl-accepting chemotaxis protein [Arcobacter venerupis]QKF68353.1 Cache sensor-containing MCP-domain signal transduction protein [Arcobacter venerupis]RWS48539.1 chemotaxis protein [Arcobacter venerupis]
MKINNIKSKLLILLFVSISCSFLILGFYNTKNKYNAEYSLIKQKELDLSQNTSKFINSYLESKIRIIEAVTNGIVDENLDISNKVLISKLLLAEESGAFASSYVGIQENGDLIKSNGILKNIAKTNYDARLRPWYKKAIEVNKAGVTEPFIDNTTKRLIITVFAPLKKDGVTIGIVGADIFLDTVVDTILNLKIGDFGFAYLLSEDGTTLIHKNKELLNKENIIFKQIKTELDNDFGQAIENDIERIAAYSKIPVVSWYLVVELDKESIFTDITKNIIHDIMLYIILLIVILLFIYLSLLKALKPLKILENGLFNFFKYLKGEEENITKLNITSNDEFENMAKIIDKEMELVEYNLEKDRKFINNVKDVVKIINEGRLDVFVESSTSNKSLNELKEIFNEMIKTISNNVDKDINCILESLKNYSQLDFTNNIKSPTGNISIGLNDLSHIINKMLQENKMNGLSLNESSEDLLANVDILNRSSNNTAVSLEETAASLEEITSTIISNTQSIATMVKYSDELSKSINIGQELANSSVESMNQINEQTKSISDAIKVIDQIAFQTNILSLNAAVEAATAGEVGKGFAVVAQEVRNLASRSAEAAKEIKELVENATIKANDGKKTTDAMINGYSNLKENLIKTEKIIQNISESSHEQKLSIEQINDVVNKLDQQTQNNASVATKTHDIAIHTANIAKKILDSVNEKRFIENIDE